MKIKFLLFSGLREAVGKGEIELIVPEGTSVGSLVEFLPEEFSKVNDLMACSRWAVNEAFVDKERILRDGDTVALISPVSGG